MIRKSGEEPQVIEYLKTPPDRATMERLIADMGITPREPLRKKGTPYEALTVLPFAAGGNGQVRHC